MTLDPEQLEQLADLVAERVSLPAARSPLVGVREVAAYLAVDPSWVYAHAAELGARRLGSGPRAPLRFSLADVDAGLSLCPPCSESRRAEVTANAASRRRRRNRSGTSVTLLPVRGQIRHESVPQEAA